MTSKAICILFSESYGASPNELAAERTLATVPFAGRYRLIDFVLSSLVKARIYDIGVITKEHYGSLMDHVGWGKDWDLDRKRGGLQILTPFTKAESAGTRNHSKVEALLSVKRYIEKVDQEYIILADTNMVMNIDFKSLLNYHIDNEADITLLYQTKVCPSHTGLVVETDSSGRVEDAYYSTIQHTEPQNTVFGVYVLSKSLLLSLLDRAYTFGWTNLERDFITKNIGKMKVYAFAHQGFSAVVNTVSDYYDASMKVLDPEVRRELFPPSTASTARFPTPWWPTAAKLTAKSATASSSAMWWWKRAPCWKTASSCRTPPSRKGRTSTASSSTRTLSSTTATPSPATLPTPMSFPRARPSDLCLLQTGPFRRGARFAILIAAEKEVCV